MQKRHESNLPPIAFERPSKRWGARIERSVHATLKAGRLVAVLEDWCPTFPGMFLYYPGRRLVPPPLRAFIDTLKASRIA